MQTIPTIQELLEAGVHFGHQVRRGHPKMGGYIFGIRDGVHIINLEESERLLKEAVEYVQKLGKEGKVLLLVGTKKQSQPIIAELAEKYNLPYINYRWMGGFLTNFDEVRKNVNKLISLKEKLEKGELGHYTKKEQLLISRKIEKSQLEYGGVKNLEKLPDALFIADCVTDETALKEAVKMGIPVIGVTDSNCNPLPINYPIPGNDDALKAIKILAETVIDAYGSGLGKGAKVTSNKTQDTNKNIDEKTEDVIDEALKGDVEQAYEEVEKETVAESTRKTS